MHVQMQEASSYGASANNATATATAPGVAGRRFYLVAVAYGYSGALPAAPVRATLSDGVTTLGFAVSGPVLFQPANPIPFAVGANVAAALGAGGAGAVGDVVLTGYFDV